MEFVGSIWRPTNCIVVGATDIHKLQSHTERRLRLQTPAYSFDCVDDVYGDVGDTGETMLGKPKGYITRTY